MQIGYQVFVEIVTHHAFDNSERGFARREIESIVDRKLIYHTFRPPWGCEIEIRNIVSKQVEKQSFLCQKRHHQRQTRGNVERTVIREYTGAHRVHIDIAVAPEILGRIREIFERHIESFFNGAVAVVYRVVDDVAGRFGVEFGIVGVAACVYTDCDAAEVGAVGDIVALDICSRFGRDLGIAADRFFRFAAGGKQQS